MQPALVKPGFDAFLAGRGLRFEAVVLGYSALALLGVVTRTTDECDVLDPEISANIAAAARAFAAVSGIDAEWLNSKAHDFVLGCVPEDWRNSSCASLSSAGRCIS